MEYLAKGVCSQKEIALHTHDRIAYRRCRRKWHFSSPFGKHLQPKPSIYGVNPNLWFGSGVHFALEDYHGFRRFSNPVDAFKAYVIASGKEVPVTVDSLVELGEGMLSHYVEWERRRVKWKTVWKDGQPLVEMKFSLVLEPLCHYKMKDGTLIFKDEYGWSDPADGSTYTEEHLAEMEAEYVEIVYHGTIDRLVEDEHGQYWILDYKTAASYDMKKLPLDTQISAYCWAAEQWLEMPVAGMLYIQMIKTVPREPKQTKTGLSTDKTQKTTHYMYRQALIDMYGEVSSAPSKNIEFLNNLASDESINGDAFIRYDWVERNTHSKELTYHNILAEGMEMLNPNTPLYPNPTRDCDWDCSFRSMCIAMEEGADWESYLFDYEERHETMNDEVPKWMMSLYRLYKEQYPEEYKRYYSANFAETLEEFIDGNKN